MHERLARRFAVDSVSPADIEVTVENLGVHDLHALLGIGVGTTLFHSISLFHARLYLLFNNLLCSAWPSFSVELPVHSLFHPLYYQFRSLFC